MAAAVADRTEATEAPPAADVFLPWEVPEKTAEVDLGRLGGQIHEVIANAKTEMQRSLRKLESLESSLQKMPGGADKSREGSLGTLPALGPTPTRSLGLGPTTSRRSEARMKRIKTSTSVAAEGKFMPLTPYLGAEWEARMQEETEYLEAKSKKRRGRKDSPGREGFASEGEGSISATTSGAEENGFKAENGLRAAANGAHPFGIGHGDSEADTEKETARADPASDAVRSKSTLGGPAVFTSSMLESPRLRIAGFVKGQTFEGVVTLMIFASAVHVGLQTDYLCRWPNDDLPLRYRVVDVAFMLFFTLEVLVRLFVHGFEFFRMRGLAWNYIDLFLVILQITEEVLTLTGFGRKSPSAYGLRIVRSLRCVRSMRILQVMEFAQELRLLVSCILHSMQAFCWSILFILMLIYIASIYYAAAVLEYRNDHRGALLDSEEYLIAEDLAAKAGNVPLAALSLFMGLTGGMDWGDMSGPMMEHVGWHWGLMFFLFVSFMFFVVLNIVTAIFVDNAMVRSEVVKHEQKLSNATRMFKALDHDNSRQITLTELLDELNRDEVQTFFKSIDINSNEARTLFQLLDVNGTGSLDFHEFVGGCIMLQGPARCIDLVRALQELQRSVDSLTLAQEPPDESP